MDELPPNEMIGASVQRREDPRLLTGDAEYTDDIQHHRDYHLAIHRSQYAHATLGEVDTAGAENSDGVLAVYTAETLRGSTADFHLQSPDPEHGTPVPQPVLATDRVRYQGQPIAAVLATDRYTAARAASRIDVEYDPEDAIVDPLEAIDDTDAPSVHAPAENNLAFEWETGDRDAATEAIAEAEKTVNVTLEINRILPTAVEPRSIVAEYEESTARLRVDLSTQKPHNMRPGLSRILGIPEREIRVRSPDVGGGFGPKCRLYPGYVMAAIAAREVDAPVKWTATRTEEHQSMVHSRHHLVDADVGVDLDGRIRGFHAETTAPVGAFLMISGVLVPTNLGLMAKGQYDIPSAYVHTRGVYTHTTPLSAYRGAGRPESTYWAERMIRAVAEDLDMDPVEVRRRNVIEPDQFPYETGLGRTYDSGAYEETMDVALDKIGYEGFRERQARARDDGRYLGIGISSYVETCGSGPGLPEVGSVQITADGTAVVKAGTAEIGTGHETAFAQIAADRLGIPPDDIEVRLGDTDQTASGGGTAGSRGVPVAGSAVTESAGKVIEKMSRIAAHELEASPADVAMEAGNFHVVGAPDRSIPFHEIAEIAHSPGDLPADVDSGLDERTHYDPENYTATFGTHVAVVEVDPESGAVEFERYVAVDDVGTQINPTVLEGQIQGGVAQGIGQALYEDVTYDENGQLLTGSLQDYPVPRAEHIPDIEWDSTVTPSPHNPLGAKGAGEAGAIAAPPAVVNAVCDALEPFDVGNLDMPLTPERIWRAVSETG